MKKTNLGAWLCLCGGILAALWTCAGMFRNLHWPGGFLLTLIAGCITVVFACLVACYLGKSDVFDAIIAAKGTSAKNLRNTLVATSIAAIVLSIAIVFRTLHWPHSGQVMLIACFTLILLFVLIGIFAYQVAKKE